jgi:arylsulfatase
MFANRALYHDGWVACTTPATLPFDPVMSPVDIIDGYAWELYHVEEDFSQAIDLAAQEPEKLKELQSLFYSEAARYNVLPLDNRKSERMDVSSRPSLTKGRTEYTYLSNVKRVTEGAAPDLKNRSFRISAEVNATNATVNGVLATQGGYFAGWSLYVKDGYPTYCYNWLSLSNYVIPSSARLTAGTNTIVLDFAYQGGGLGLGGTVTLRLNGQVVGQGRVENTAGYRISFDETFDVGEDTGTPVSDDYAVPFAFTDELKRLTITLDPVPGADQARVAAAALDGRIERGLRD